MKKDLDSIEALVLQARKLRILCVKYALGSTAQNGRWPPVDCTRTSPRLHLPGKSVVRQNKQLGAGWHAPKVPPSAADPARRSRCHGLSTPFSNSQGPVQKIYAPCGSRVRRHALKNNGVVDTAPCFPSFSWPSASWRRRLMVSISAVLGLLASAHAPSFCHFCGLPAPNTMVGRREEGRYNTQSFTYFNTVGIIFLPTPTSLAHVRHKQVHTSRLVCGARRNAGCLPGRCAAHSQPTLCSEQNTLMCSQGNGQITAQIVERQTPPPPSFSPSAWVRETRGRSLPEPSFTSTGQYLLFANESSA